MKTIITFLLLSTSLFSLYSQVVPQGQGYYNLSPPPNGNIPSRADGNPVFPKVTNNFNQAVTSNDWWSSLIYNYYDNQTFVWEKHSWKLFPHPMSMQAVRYGLKVLYPDQLSITDAFGITDGEYRYNMEIEDFTIGVDGLDLGNIQEVQVENYGDWHVTCVWDDDNGNQLKATMGHGFPFVYFEKTGGNAYLRFLYGHTVNHNIDDNVIGFTHNGHHYGLFAPSGSTWTTSSYEHDEAAFVGSSPNIVNRTALKSDLNGQNYFSIALLPDNSLATLIEYSNHAFAFITDTDVTWQYDENTAQLNTIFTATTEAKEGTETRPLQSLYRHQWLNSSDVNTTHKYLSARGEMKVYKGNSFTTSLKNNGIIPALPLTLDAAQEAILYQYIEDERQASNIYAVPEDTYWIGKRFSRQAELVQIAHQVQHFAARDKFLNDLKTELEDWFQADNSESSRGYFYYNDTWDALIGYPASFGSDIRLTDHHFHYGYFIKAVATIAQFDPTWASDENWGAMAKLLIKDVNNWDKSDTQFPFLRYFDAYAGHSWASGHGNFHWGNDQESSSEAMNFAVSVFQLGIVLDDMELRDLGLFLYLNEASAIEQYWFDMDETVLPAGYGFDSASRIWGTGVNRASGSQSFELEPEYWLGINALPLNAASLYLGKHPTLTEQLYTEMTNANGDVEDNLWEDLMWMFQAMYAPTAAIAKYENHTAGGAYTTNLPYIPSVNGIYQPLSGEQISPAQLYHWLYNLENLGQVDATVCADYPATMVFNKNGEKSYVIYNPPNSMERIVTFSDGTIVTAPANELFLYQPATLATVDLSLSAELTTSKTVSLTWQNAINVPTFFVERTNSVSHFSSVMSSTIGRISNTSLLQFEDKHPLVGTNYYRLTWTDEFGNPHFSEVVNVGVEGILQDLVISPNPVKETLRCALVHTLSDNIQFEILNIQGQVLHHAPLPTSSNLSLNISVPDLKAGFYFLKIRDIENNIYLGRFLKL